MKFIHFGCWNEGYCNKINTTVNGISATMDLLNKTVDSEKFNFISIAGDNYYATEVEEPVVHKVFDERNFISGFNCLPKDILKVVIFGNHEIEKKVEFDGSVVLCGSLIKQVELSHNVPNLEIFNDIIYKYNDNTLIIFIDTTIYTMGEEMINETCYKTLNINNGSKLLPYKVFRDSTIDESQSINKLVDYMNNKILEIINNFIIKEGSSFKNLIIIGHEPIYGLKLKIDKKTLDRKHKISILTKFISFITDKLIPILQTNNIKTYYLCADIHIYQYGIITFTNTNYIIEQHIVGTGGAHQDIISDKLENNYLDTLKYKIIEQSQNFGFITVNIINQNVDINYISVTDISVTEPVLKGGGDKLMWYNKYMKYKMKYMNYKKNINL